MTVEEKKEAGLNPFEVMNLRARSGFAKWYVFTLALLFAFMEIFYIMSYYTTLANSIGYLGVKLGIPGLKNFSIDLIRALFINSKSQYGITLGFLLAVGFVLFPVKRLALQASKEEVEEYVEKYAKRIPWYDYALSFISLIVFFYMAWLETQIVAYEGSLPPNAGILPVIMAAIGFALAFELTRRSVGPWLVGVVAFFLGYYFYYMKTTFPITWHTVVVKWAQDMFYWSSGLFNIPFQVMAAYVFAFLFFGAFLEKIGIGGYITRLMLALFGKKPGGPAKVAIVSSGFMGMLSGSSVANVFTTGTFTIPMMKRSGFPPEVAGAVEASASTGGQIMPPVMGAAAFIMAMYLGRPYGEIVIAAFLPAFIYFASLYYFVDLEAKRRGLRGLPPEQLPDARELAKKIYLFLPVVIITLLLVMRLEPHYSAIASLGTALVVGIWAMEQFTKGQKTLYTLLYILLTIIALWVFPRAIAALYFVGVLLLVLSAFLVFTRGFKSLGWMVLDSIETAVRSSVPVFMAATLAGVVQGSLTLTGLSNRLGERFIALAHNNIYVLLLLAGILSIIVGMGVPTTANYVITSLLSAGAITMAAVTMLHLVRKTAMLGAHMFVFYYGILADLTPPVALAAFAGATVARADFWKTAVNATRFGFAKYVLPFVFAVNPAMLILPIMEHTMTWWQFFWSIFSVVAVIVAASAGFAGYLGGRIDSSVLRILLVIVGILAIFSNVPVVLLWRTPGAVLEALAHGPYTPSMLYRLLEFSFALIAYAAIIIVYLRNRAISEKAR